MNESSYKKVRYTFKCKTVTPLLNYGATYKEILPRTASLKGMIRYWWRVIKPLISNKSFLTAEKLLQEEIKLFGGINEKNDTAIKSPVKVSIDRIKKFKEKFYSNDGLIKSLITRNPYFYGTFNVTLNGKIGDYKTRQQSVTKRIISPEQWDEILFSTHVSLLLGGLGKRSRRGFGSIEIINNEKKDINVRDYILSFFKYYKSKFPELNYTHEEILTDDMDYKYKKFDLICFNRKGRTNHSFLKAIWIGPQEYTQNNKLIELLTKINHAKRKLYSSINDKQIIQEVLGCVYIHTRDTEKTCECFRRDVSYKNKKRYASQLWVKIFKINNQLVPIYIYLCPSSSTVCDRSRTCNEQTSSNFNHCYDAIHRDHLKVIKEFIKNSQ